MVVKVSKPEINVREKISELDKPSGTAGQAMLAAETPQEQFNLIGAGRRNLIINGAMQVEQRGAYTISTTGSPEYGGPDRFHVWSYTSGEEVTAEISKSTVGGTPTGFANTYRFDVLTAESSVAAAESVVVAQYIEAQDCQHLEYGTSDAKPVTLSFWIKTSITGTYCFFLQNDDGDRIQVKEYTVNSANTWEKKIITIPGDASGTINNDSGRGLWCGWVLMAGTDRHGSKDTWRTTDADYATSSQVNALNNTANNIYLTGIQLEVGKVATPFEHRSYGEELALCQRYYQKFHDPGSPTAQIMLIGLSSTYTQFSWWPPVEMRVRPTVGVTDTSPYWESHPWYAVGTSLTITQVSNAHISRYGGEISVAGNWNPAPVRGTNYNITGEVFYWDAEL